MEATTLLRAQVELPPCAVQVHPENDNLWVVGTYQLDESTRTRHGTIDLYECGECICQQRTESSVLDVKISPHTSAVVLSAQSTGSVIVWKLDVEAKRLERVEEFQLFDKDTLVLSLAFSLENQNQVSVTLTTGEVALLEFSNSALIVLAVSSPHMDQCWISEFGTQTLGHVLWSGADDCMLIAHDTRTLGEQVIWQKRLHDAGVTSILPSSNKWKSSSPFALWTGGYDDKVQSIDLRTNDTLESYHIPRVLDKKDLGGGVWRLLPSPNDDRVLACCMYGGARILDADMNVVKEYTQEHESMVYGGGWLHDGDSVVTCSFYDKKLRSWSV